MKDFFHHLLFPRESNNHRPKLLHHDSLLLVIVLILFVAALFSVVHNTQPAVLGISTNMTVDELVSLTNTERKKAGLPELALNQQLSNAALKKGHDMFAHNYWAHISPDGTTPWYFIKDAGYEYLYAGENLARGFTTAPETVAAWMASPSHRENILSKNYDEVGFAVLPGTLTGSETILVVEMFGRKYVEGSAEAVAPLETSVPPSSQLPKEQPVTAVASVQTSPLFSSETFPRQIALILLGVFIIVLFLDAVIIARKRIARVVAHNVDHILFLTIIALAVIILGRGFVL